MISEEFRKYGKEMVDFVADYWDSLDQSNGPFKPLADVKPGYIWDLVDQKKKLKGKNNFF